MKAVPDPKWSVDKLAIERGWTEELVARLLGKPDEVVNDVGLYSKTRVELAEQDAAFLAHQADVQREQMASAKELDELFAPILNDDLEADEIEDVLGAVLKFFSATTTTELFYASERVEDVDTLIDAAIKRLEQLKRARATRPT